MSEEGNGNTVGKALYSISESSTVRMTLVIALCGGVWWGSKTLSALETQIQANQLVLSAKIETQSILTEQLAREVRDLNERVRELEQKAQK